MHRVRRQIVLLIVERLFLLKSVKNVWFSDDFSGNQSSLIRLNSLNIEAKLETIPCKVWSKGDPFIQNLIHYLINILQHCLKEPLRDIFSIFMFSWVNLLVTVYCGNNL